jgi:hypothetical protein
MLEIVSLLTIAIQAINKRSDTFIRSNDGTTGSKRRLSYVRDHLAKEGHNVPEVGFTQTPWSVNLPS